MISNFFHYVYISYTIDSFVPAEFRLAFGTVQSLMTGVLQI